MTPAGSPAKQTASLLRERVRRVFREYPGALAGEEEPIHQVRVAGRRLRVALPLLARKPAGRRVKKARRILRDLTRAAGAGRDLDVLLALYEKRLDELGSVSREQKDLRRRMRAARTRSRSGLTEGVLDLDIDGLRRQLRLIKGRGMADTETVLSRTREVTERDGRRVLEGLAEVGDRYDPDALHALRRRIRELRYTAEVDEALGGREAAASAAWKKLQDAIGALHDAHVLSGWFRAQAERATTRGKSALAAAARAEQEFCEAEGRRLHQALLESRPEEIVAGAVGMASSAAKPPAAGREAGPANASPTPRAPYETAARLPAIPPSA